MRWWPLAVILVACAQPLAPPPPPVFPTLVRGETYNTRISDLRSTLGRAGIKLRLAGQDVSIETDGCEIGNAAACSRCYLAGEMTPIDGAVIEAATRAFATYPQDVLERAQIAYVAVCRDLSYTDQDTERIGGLSDFRSHGLLIGVSYFLDRAYNSHGEITVADIAHHELFHLLEHAQMLDDMKNDPEWLLQNPLGFEYAESNSKENRRDGFVNPYAATAVHEDKASVYEMMMARSEVLCELAKIDETIKIKARIIWRRVLRAAGTDSFIRTAAPCVDWLDF